MELLELRQMLSADLVAAAESADFALDEMPPEPPGLDQGLDLQAAALFPLGQTFLLHSNPSATKTIYLDFDGHTTTGTTWNSAYGDPIVTPAWSSDGSSSFSNSELEFVQRVWERVSEDFLPFNVDVTTQDPGVANLRNTGGSDTRWGMRVVIGPENWYPNSAGGVAYLSTFGQLNSDNPCFVFNTSETGIAEAASHEAGHTLGLSHDGTTTGLEYYEGHGSGATGWAPIMGVGYYVSLVQWSKGEYPNANRTEDDLQIITGTSRNGFGYRTDDHGNTTSAATSISLVGNSLTDDGIIERTSDLDFFSFTLGAGTLNLDVDPFYRSPNLDIVAKLYNSAGSVIATSNPATALDASFSLSLPAGLYYLSVDGTGKPAGSDPGYSDYGSLGYFKITGTLTPVATPQLRVVNLTDAVTLVDGSSDIDFGNVEFGTLGKVKILEVFNDGTADLTLGPVQLPTGYTLLQAPRGVLDPGGSDNLIVRMDAEALGLQFGGLSFTSNGVADGTFNLSLGGAVLPTTAQIAYISDLVDPNDPTVQNGWGPIELNHSNGEKDPHDGVTMTLNGRQYAKGVGAHALSSFVVNLDGSYTRFIADVGVDDEAPPLGSIVFQVYLDGVLADQTAVLLVDSPIRYFDVDVAGVKELRLVITDGGNGENSDHGDWANARLIAPVGPHILVEDQTAGGTIRDGVSTAVFGAVEGGTLGNIRTFIVHNGGTAAMSVGAVQLPAGYTLLKAPPSTLAPGASDTMIVRLDSDVVDVAEGDASFATDGVADGVFTFHLSGLVFPSLEHVRYLSDFVSPDSPNVSNGWGPIELDHSNGEKDSHDGVTMTLNGRQYAKGIGAHALSSILIDLGGGFTRFIADVGVDDEAPALGSIVFQVYLDGVLADETGVLVVDSPIEYFDIDVTGAHLMQLVITDSGNGDNSDHGDWANARLLAPRAPADFDVDADVDGVDFLSWQRGFGAGPGATKATGDANNNGVVDGTDFEAWTGGFGGVLAPSNSAPFAAEASSESASAALLVAGVSGRGAGGLDLAAIQLPLLPSTGRLSVAAWRRPAELAAKDAALTRPTGSAPTGNARLAEASAIERETPEFRLAADADDPTGDADEITIDRAFASMIQAVQTPRQTPK